MIDYIYYMLNLKNINSKQVLKYFSTFDFLFSIFT